MENMSAEMFVPTVEMLTVIGIMYGGLGIIYGIAYWVVSVNRDRKEFKEFMRESREQFTKLAVLIGELTARMDLHEKGLADLSRRFDEYILRLPPKAGDGTSPPATGANQQKRPPT